MWWLGCVPLIVSVFLLSEYNCGWQQTSKSLYMFQYFIKVVSTQFRTLNGQIVWLHWSLRIYFAEFSIRLTRISIAPRNLNVICRKEQTVTLLGAFIYNTVWAVCQVRYIYSEVLSNDDRNHFLVCRHLFQLRNFAHPRCARWSPSIICPFHNIVSLSIVYFIHSILTLIVSEHVPLSEGFLQLRHCWTVFYLPRAALWRSQEMVMVGNLCEELEWLHTYYAQVSFVLY